MAITKENYESGLLSGIEFLSGLNSKKLYADIAEEDYLTRTRGRAAKLLEGELSVGELIEKYLRDTGSGNGLYDAGLVDSSLLVIDVIGIYKSDDFRRSVHEKNANLEDGEQPIDFFEALACELSIEIDAAKASVHYYKDNEHYFDAYLTVVEGMNKVDPRLKRK